MQLVGSAAQSAELARDTGVASTNLSNTTESCRLAPMAQNISGMPCRSVTRRRLSPSLPLSVGLGLVCEPPGNWTRWPVRANPTEVQPTGTPQLSLQQQMKLMPHACCLPLAQATPAGHAAAKAQFLRQIHLGRISAQRERDAVERQFIAQSRVTFAW